jgi:hypothetical protein
MRGETGSEDTPKKTYSYFHCRRCKKYFAMNSYIGSFCPFCSTPARDAQDFPLRVLTTDTPVRDRLFIAMPKCTYCPELYRCPECFREEKRNPDKCRNCPCAGCCNETIEFANEVRSGRISLWQAVLDSAGKRGAKPGPMAKLMEKEFEDEIPF